MSEIPNLGPTPHYLFWTRHREWTFLWTNPIYASTWKPPKYVKSWPVGALVVGASGHCRITLLPKRAQSQDEVAHVQAHVYTAALLGAYGCNAAHISFPPRNMTTDMRTFRSLCTWEVQARLCHPRSRSKRLPPTPIQHPNLWNPIAAHGNAECLGRHSLLSASEQLDVFRAPL